MTRLLPPAVAFIAAAAILAGCGGDSGFAVQGDTTVTPRASLTKAEFIRRADNLCMRNWHLVVADFLEYRDGLRTSEPQLTAEQRLVKAIRSAYFEAIDPRIVTELQAIGAPAGEAKAVEELIGSMQEAIERGERGEPVTTRPGVMALFAGYNRKAERYGIPQCRMSRLALPRG